MTTLKENFDFEKFYSVLDEYLLYLMDEHQDYTKILGDKRKTVNIYLNDIEKAISDNIDINFYQNECDSLEEQLNNLYVDVLELNTFNSSFPSKVLIIESLSLLEKIKNHFISLEKYENCTILQEVMDLIKE